MQGGNFAMLYFSLSLERKSQDSNVNIPDFILFTSIDNNLKSHYWKND